MFDVSRVFSSQHRQAPEEDRPTTTASSTGKEGSCKEGCERETQGERQSMQLLSPDPMSLLLLRTSGARLLPCSVPIYSPPGCPGPFLATHVSVTYGTIAL